MEKMDLLKNINNSKKIYCSGHFIFHQKNTRVLAKDINKFTNFKNF